MKFIFSCVLAVVLLVSVIEAATFVPNPLSCGFKITYKLISKANGQTFNYDKWLGMYNKYYATYSTGPGQGGETMKSFNLIRLDIPDPENPKTAAVFFYGHQGGKDMCMFSDYNSYDNLYFDMDQDYKYFTQPFEYDTKKENDNWMGAVCTSYSKKTSEENTTIYVIADNTVIGAYYEDSKRSFSYDVETIEKVAYASCFTIEKNYTGCESYPKAYKMLELEETCEIVNDLGSDSSDSSDNMAVSTEVSIFAIIFAVLMSFFTLLF